MSDDQKIEKLEAAVTELEKKQNLFNHGAWCATYIGIGLFLSGWIIRIAYSGWPPEHLGSYLSGTAGAVWGFSGLLFIYLGFLGQKQEIKNQQIELILTRVEMKANRNELSGQKEQLQLQKESLNRQAVALEEQVKALSRSNNYKICFDAIHDLFDFLNQNTSINGDGVPIRYYLRKKFLHYHDKEKKTFNSQYITAKISDDRETDFILRFEHLYSGIASALDSVLVSNDKKILTHLLFSRVTDTVNPELLSLDLDSLAGIEKLDQSPLFHSIKNIVNLQNEFNSIYNA